MIAEQMKSVSSILRYDHGYKESIYNIVSCDYDMGKCPRRFVYIARRNQKYSAVNIRPWQFL